MYARNTLNLGKMFDSFEIIVVIKGYPEVLLTTLLPTSSQNYQETLGMVSLLLKIDSILDTFLFLIL